MSSSCSVGAACIILVNLSLVINVVISKGETQTTKAAGFNGSIRAIYVFGDSTVDPGNNNYIATPLKSDFPPYGRDFSNHIPTGRFSNRRLVTDFIASYMGIKDYVPPYLDPTLRMEELMTGASFASAGSGFDPLTPVVSGVIPIKKQVEYFKDYIRRMEVAIGKEGAENLVNKAMFVISAGTNDFIANYLELPIRRRSYTLTSYYHFLLQNIQQFIQALMELGARKIVMSGIPPIECLPIVITLQSNNLINTFGTRQCIARLSSVALDYNKILTQKLKHMQSTDVKISYADIYSPLRNIFHSPKKFGFEEISSGCCGTGLLETSILCNAKSKMCSDVSSYVFFDAVHPTERTYFIIFKTIRSAIDLLTKG